MAKQVQFRRGTTSQHSSFTGVVGEITVDTDKDTIVVHDGSKAGGFAVQAYANIAVTVSGGKYYIDGSQQLLTHLTPSVVYRFDQSEGTNSGHPFRLSTTSDGTHGGGSAYTTGVTTVGTAGSAGAYVEVILEQDAPDTLYYYCGSHSAMGGQIDTKATVSSLSDLGVSATAAQLNHSVGVTSAIQTQLDAKQAVVTNVSDTEIGYLDGVTSAIQTQLNAKGTVSSLSDLSVTSTSAELNYNDITTLGTVQASKVVTADANGDVTFPDNEKLKLGTGGDLEVYHDSTHSIIKDAGTGDLWIAGDNALNVTTADFTEYKARFVKDESVYLYHNNAEKFKTTSTGADVTGKLDVSKGIVDTTTTVSYASSIALTLDNGAIQTVTLTGNATFTDSLNDGEAIVLMLNGGASHTVTWTAVTKWVTGSGNAAPTLTASDAIILWKIGSSVYAATAGSFA